MAAKIFWITYSAYTRAVPEEHADTLLEMLSSENQAEWHKSEEYAVVWSKMYTFVLDYYLEQFESLADKYLESPAGKLFTQAVSKARASGRKIPLMDEHSITAFEGAEGISWTVKEIGDIFRILFMVSDTCDTSEVCFEYV